ncbi:hypothetical protein AAFF_G00369630 [Aldrovandia affinis]|uniref:Ran-binding protein 3-like n=1 Tax=Aldrovandia affinis TaxID=143900 RepID=A0AAD7R5A4_9TELE|nr:hypothetical protein AAFF_G00369630 [Aldrovandia affinis]
MGAERGSKMADLVNEEKPAIAPPVFVFQKEKATKRSASGSSGEDGEDSDKEDVCYCPPVKRERKSSLTQFPPAHSVSKNNVFLPSSFCQSPTGNSDSEPACAGLAEEKTVGFRLKPPTLIHGQAPSTGVPSPKPKEQQRTVLRPALLQAPPAKGRTQSNSNSGTNGVNKTLDGTSEERPVGQGDDDITGEGTTPQVEDGREPSKCKDAQSGGTNYFLQYISTPADERETPPAPPPEPPTQEAPPERVNSTVESLEESAAAYTKATAKHCLLEKVEVVTGEESESNVLQIQCKLFVFDKMSQSWVERGRGLLRLNDMASTEDGTLQSRLVMRTQGSLRLILNTKLWPQMQIDKASEKSIRITAMDTEDQGVKVFLISASSKDTGQLSAALHHRILALRSRAEQEVETKPAP